jgi:hypothetical protein
MAGLAVAGREDAADRRRRDEQGAGDADGLGAVVTVI